MNSNREWFVGIDWATEEHAVCIIDDAGKVVGERAFAHTGAGIADMCRWLLETTGASSDSIHVAIEIPRGAVVETLLERGMRVHSINPKQLDRFRDRFTVAGAKDDRRDAHVLADSLRTDRQCFRHLRIDDPLIIELREHSRIAEELTTERIRLANRVRDQLLRYYPQMLELADDVADDWFLALWKLAPTPKDASRLREKAVAKFLLQRRIRRFDAKHIIVTLRQQPLMVADGTWSAATAHIASLAERIELVNRQLKATNRRLDQLLEQLEAKEPEPGQMCEPRDVTILRSFRGVGRMVIVTLLAEASQPLAQRDYHALRILCGSAPVTQQTGKQGKTRGHRPRIVMRQAASPRLRNAVYHWANVATQRDETEKAAYASLRARGHSHGRALRTISDRLLRVACAALRDGTLFDPELRSAS